MCNIKLWRCDAHQNKIHGFRIERCEGCEPVKPAPKGDIAVPETIYVKELHLTQEKGCEGFRFPHPVQWMTTCPVVPSTRRDGGN
ncbi:hypothetical protein PG985_012747 [Apiospora marii]|uniref:uncharacterized protein n=1 Tax=Apiospora marii TaxID=335849 RepID=UPI00312F7059